MGRVARHFLQPLRRCSSGWSAAAPEEPLADGWKPSLSDFVLGLSVRRHVTGYALLRFDDLLPLQFGLIDVRKAVEVQQKALEVAAVLRDLRQAAPEKLRQVAPAALHLRMAQKDAQGKRAWRWVVSIDDSTVDRSPPTNARESGTQRTIAMLQGLVLADAKRLFRVAPTVVHPRKSRLQLGVRKNGPAGRKEIFDIASSQVTDFPVVRHRSGTLAEDSLLMSDAWASARFAQREALLVEKRQDQQLIADLRQRVLDSKKFKRIAEAVEELHPRRAGRELAEAMDTKVNQAVDEQLHKILDRELRRRQADFVRESEEALEEGGEDDDFADAFRDMAPRGRDSASPYYQDVG